MSKKRPQKLIVVDDLGEISSLNPTDYYSWQAAKQLVADLEDADEENLFDDIDDDDAVEIVGREEFTFDLDFPIVTEARKRISEGITTERVVLLKYTAYTSTATISFWAAGGNKWAISIVAGTVVIWVLQEIQDYLRNRK